MFIFWLVVLKGIRSLKFFKIFMGIVECGELCVW